MRHDTCILTTKDFAMLEALHDRCSATSGKWRALLYRKLDTANILFRDDVPPNVATLNSRICFRVDHGDADTRVLSHDRMTLPVGLLLPLTSLRGLALFGLREGQAISIGDDEGKTEHILLERVLYQPEAARMEREEASRASLPASRRAAFRVVSGGLDVSPSFDRPRPFSGGSGDPGPSAA
ncbi:nucleoside-diphosphate kinase [Oricola nitratireducens]|uniref:nucleoside-diphosphate kinase n=1 Tax=Oricola nitratireducens TaxID=2775868 RepID=UPI001866A4E2|nr:nucleoside-diphosphate kinase [Oricola nitratireducens]